MDVRALGGVMLLAGGSALLLAALRRNVGKAAPEPVTLAELSRIWLPEHRRQAIEDAKLNEPNEPEEALAFSNPLIAEYYRNRVNGMQGAEAARLVIGRILQLLDEHGNCPSVAGTKGDPEASLDTDVFETLGAVTLAEHTLHVADEMGRRFPDALPAKAMVAALGHDLGKIPSYRDRLYRMGDHPLISIAVLETVDGYAELSFRDEVNAAIRDHHKAPRGVLAERLKEADQAARRRELATLKTPTTRHDTQAPRSAPVDATPRHATTRNPADDTLSTMRDDTRRHADHPDIFGASNHAEKETPILETDISWFDPDAFIKELAPLVNRMYGGRWYAFSMPDGTVYVQTQSLWEAAKSLARAKGETGVLAGDADRGVRQSVLLSIVQRLKSERDAVARGLVRDGYFGGRFLLTMADGQTIRAFYTPLSAHVFADTVSELEERKEGTIRKIANVEPDWGDDE